MSCKYFIKHFIIYPPSSYTTRVLSSCTPVRPQNIVRLRHPPYRRRGRCCWHCRQQHTLWLNMFTSLSWFACSCRRRTDATTDDRRRSQPPRGRSAHTQRLQPHTFYQFVAQTDRRRCCVAVSPWPFVWPPRGLLAMRHIVVGTERTMFVGWPLGAISVNGAFAVAFRCGVRAFACRVRRPDYRRDTHIYRVLFMCIMMCAGAVHAKAESQYEDGNRFGGFLVYILFIGRLSLGHLESRGRSDNEVLWEAVQNVRSYYAEVKKVKYRICISIKNAYKKNDTTFNYDNFSTIYSKNHIVNISHLFRRINISHPNIPIRIILRHLHLRLTKPNGIWADVIRYCGNSVVRCCDDFEMKKYPHMLWFFHSGNIDTKSNSTHPQVN